ncbi:kinesin-like protein KIF27 isoform X4 [Pan paniscus]|uniref:kinesin-like protein KIF27 isoform X4 n=1 Tax=Pan paniscus TaxID=9597 RepID=UPI001561A4D7|nr:kinesin-like protein KIF27 isoform X4 [Pan paniscus]XP_054947921.1 kinesin-like protein KIF27 isoform X4 [Pan paniscus]XP_054947922.1 kinesin-like protein KIF27 isoform X4 [Pan paniscus]XP_054947923.1 kinesin-like protein KIF27 isoform X4 [Pan paniscus]XP_054947924.1 kinesin-like protein KIF27 isoform X4 [Pan paniscus]
MEEIPVKVAVRIRPLLCKEALHNHQVCVRVIPNSQQVIIGRDRVFTFDFVFGKNSTQDEVYNTCIKPLVLSLIEGYNATVFAYGQTGSGKTYTIGGGHIASVVEGQKGIIPRAIQEIFQSISEHPSIDFNVKVSYIEVYKEDLRDLLELETSMKDLHIREDEKGNTVIVGAKECHVESAGEVMSLLEMGNAARHTGTTQMNEHSSRSHAIFTISICQVHKNMEAAEDGSWYSPRHIVSKFHFVDLAGSERVTKTGNTGERFKESIQINSGLLALGNVISALGDPRRKSSHIPYRDAKITRLLKDSLGGSAKTVMITCVSPSSSNFDESLNSLKYANRARNIRNKPTVNFSPESDRIDEMEFEIKLLREALQSQQAGVSQTTQINREGSPDTNRIHSLEEQVAQLQGECLGYQCCVEEAFTFLVDLKDTVRLNEKQQHKLQEWFNMIQEVRKAVLTSFRGIGGTASLEEGPQHVTVLQLKRELKKCQCVLAADEVVFNQKELEVKELKNQVQTMVQENKGHAVSLKEAQKVNRLQNEKIIEQQLLVDQLSEELTKLNLSVTSSAKENCGDGPDARIPERRPYTVPFDTHLGHYIYIPSRQDSRKVHTSPPMYSLDRIFAGFRTRSQMLLGHIEEQDEVLHCQFSDNSDDEESEGQEKSGTRCRSRSWIQKPDSVCSLVELSDTQDETQKSDLENEDLKIDCLQESQELNLQKLKNSERILTEAKQKMRELTINIKMKEDLIKELIKTGNDVKSVSKQYSLKVTKLEHDAEQAKVELIKTQKQLQELENKDLSDVAMKVKLQKEFRKKMDAAKLRVQVLQKKQQDSKKLASLSIQNEKRANELEQSVDHMKYQKIELQRKLREENEKRKQLDAVIKRDQQKIKEIQLKTRQEEGLKPKAEDLDACNLKRRKGSFGSIDHLQKLDEQKKWLDEEVEKVLNQRQELEELEEDLKKREAIVSKKEALLQEKSHLENKKLRSSQALNTDSLKISTRLNLLEQELSEKNVQLQTSTAEEKTKISEQVEVLQKEKDQLQKRRHSVDEKLKNGRVLSPEEEHVLFQLEEGIEALEAAIEYKNESIQNRQKSLRASFHNLSRGEANVLEKLACLSPVEIRAILFRYFNKVVNLREAERKQQLHNEEMKMKVLERDNMVRELESALDHLKLQCDRRLTLQQKEHEQKMQLLLHHFKEQDGEGIMETFKTYEDKIQQLEKDLYFYKKTSRDHKKKLKELVGEAIRRQLAPSEYQEAGDGVLKPEGGGMLSEELKWASRPESMKLSGREREMDSSANSLRTQPNPQKLWEDIPELPPIHSSLAPPSGHMLGNENKTEIDDNQFTKSHSRLSSQIQVVGNVGQLHGVTPVKLCRKELRQISALELSLRRSSLGVGIGSMAADSIEVSRKPRDLKT